jgi:hypothetical protein
VHRVIEHPGVQNTLEQVSALKIKQLAWVCTLCAVLERYLGPMPNEVQP